MALIHIMVSWVMTPHSDVIVYHYFGGPWSLQLHPEDRGNMSL